MASLPGSTSLTRAGMDLQIGTIRTVIGASLLARPPLLARALGADRVTAQRLGWLTAMVGIRELAVGGGTLAATRRGDSRPWLVAGVLCDTADAVILGRAVARGHVNRVLGSLVALSALGGVAMGVAAALGSNGSATD